MTDSTDLKLGFILPKGKRLVLFLCVTVFCFIIAGLINGFIMKINGMSEVALRISAVIQDVLAFVVPSLVTALLITRLPARFLAIEHAPRLSQIVLACVILFVSVPAMNALVAWNESITLPESMQGVEDWMRQAEETARASVSALLGGSGVGSFIVSLLIVGVLAGFSEELFFRGTMQRLLTTGGMGHHFAIWLVAFIFSAGHLQFYGFFGRLFLGAYFGYLLYWTRCLWVPVIIHILNNILYITGNRFADGADFNPDTLGADNASLAIASAILVGFGIWIFRKKCSATV